MAYSEILAERVRDALAGAGRVSEKRMFGGLAFMLNQKMCVTVGESRIMVRVDPAIHDELVKHKGASAMTMGGKTYKGYIRVDDSALKRARDLKAWVKHALAFNGRARKARKPRAKPASQ